VSRSATSLRFASTLSTTHRPIGSRRKSRVARARHTPPPEAALPAGTV